MGNAVPASLRWGPPKKTHTHTYIYIYIYVYIHVYIYVYIHVYIYISTICYFLRSHLTNNDGIYSVSWDMQ